MIERATLKRIIDKYRLQSPIPEEIQDFVIDSRIRVLKKNLKISGGFSAVYWPVIRIFFEARKHGLRPSLTISRLFVWTVSMIIAGSLSAGIIYAVSVYSSGKTGITAGQIINGQKAASQPEDKKEKLIEYQIGVKLFLAKDVDNELAERITDAIAGELVKIKGETKVINLRHKGGRVKNDLIGTVMKPGAEYVIYAKVVDKDSSVISAVSERMTSPEELTAVCRNIAEKIAAEVE